MALETGMNILNPLHSWPNKPSYEERLVKCASRGFPVVIPGLDESCIDGCRIRRLELAELKGLARLLKLSFKAEILSPDTLSTYDGDGVNATGAIIPAVYMDFVEPDYMNRAENIRRHSAVEVRTISADRSFTLVSSTVLPQVNTLQHGKKLLTQVQMPPRGCRVVSRMLGYSRSARVSIETCILKSLISTMFTTSRPTRSCKENNAHGFNRFMERLYVGEFIKQTTPSLLAGSKLTLLSMKDRLV
jgi:hypothetical protein